MNTRFDRDGNSISDGALRRWQKFRAQLPQIRPRSLAPSPPRFRVVVEGSRVRGISRGRGELFVSPVFSVYVCVYGMRVWGGWLCDGDLIEVWGRWRKVWPLLCWGNKRPCVTFFYKCFGGVDFYVDKFYWGDWESLDLDISNVLIGIKEFLVIRILYIQ